MKRFFSALAAILVSGALIAAPIPNIPQNPTYSEASQIIATLNALIAQLNGQTGYAPAATITIGSNCISAAGASPVTCNGQSGTANFTGITVAATGTNQTIVVTNSAITTASNCRANFNSAFTAGSAVVVATLTPTAGSLSVVIANAGTTTNAVTTGALGFNCT